jgi:hypothetical protein
MARLRSVRFVFPPFRPFAMSQPPSASQSSAPSNQSRLQFATARRKLLDQRRSLTSLVTDKGSARQWLDAFLPVQVRVRCLGVSCR